MAEIRPARSGDATAVAELLDELGYLTTPAQAAERIATFSAGSRDRLLVAERDGRVVGVCAVGTVPLLAEAGALARITALAVAGTARQTGVGTALVRAAEAWSRRAGCTVVQVHSGRRPERAAAHRFYPALGYADTADHHALYAKRLAGGPP